MCLGGCSLIGQNQLTPSNPTPQINHKNPHIRGTITSLTIHEDQTASIFVKGVKEADTKYEEAFVSINSKTKIFIQSIDEIRSGDQKDLEIGVTVEVLFVGAIATSYPVQATAGEIIIDMIEP